MALYHAYSEVENSNTGVPMAGVQVVPVFPNTGGPGVGVAAPIYADESETPFVPANTCLTDETGMYSFYIEPGSYNLDFFIGSRFIRRIEDVQFINPIPTNVEEPYRATLSEALNEFPIGFYFRSDDKNAEGPHPNEMWIYQRIGLDPGYVALVSNTASMQELNEAIAEAEAAATEAQNYGNATLRSDYTAADAETWTAGTWVQILSTDTGTHASKAGDFGASGGQTPNAGLFQEDATLGLIRKGANEGQVAQGYSLSAQAWAQSPTAPDPLDPTSKSAKTWALYLGDVSTRILPTNTSFKSGSALSGFVGMPETDINGSVLKGQRADGTLYAKLSPSDVLGAIDSVKPSLIAPLDRLKSAILANPTRALPVVMAVPPTITVGASGSNGSSSLKAGWSFISVTANNANQYFTMLNRADWTVAFNTNGNDHYYAPTTATEIVGHGVVAFEHQGRTFEILGRRDEAWTILVDEGGLLGWRLVSATPVLTPAVGTGIIPIAVKIDFGSAATRKVVAICRTNGFAGIRVGPTDSIKALDLSAMPSISVMSDSYGNSSSSVISGGGLFAATALRLGALKFFISPGGGSGYITGGTANKTFTDATRLTALNRGTPDIVLVAGGVNDGTAIQAASLTVYQSARAANPSAIIVVVSTWTPPVQGGGSGSTAAQQAKRDANLAALRQISGPWVFVDTVSGRWYNSADKTGLCGPVPWMTGDGRYVLFTAAPTLGATSGTLATGWNGTTGTYTMRFGNWEERTVTLTAGNTAVSWTGGLTAAQTTAKAGVYTAIPGNSVNIISDGTHVGDTGPDYLAAFVADAVADAILKL